MGARVVEGEPDDPLGALAADRLDRDAGAGGDLAGLELVQLGDHLLRLVAAGLVLDSGVQILRVLADDHEIDVVVTRADARVRLARAEAGVETELVSQRDVDRAEPGADRGGDRAFQRDAVRLDGSERLLRQRCPRRLHHVDACLTHVPVELDAGRLQNAAGRLGQLGAGAVARNQSHAVRHPGSEGTDPSLAARSVLSAHVSTTSDFKPGLEGVVAVETEIMEPDRDGGSLRYRGVDVEPLVGKYPYENVWGLLVDQDIRSKMPDPEPYEPAGLTGDTPADLQANTARLSGVWQLGKLSEISDAQAREDLGRLSAQVMSIVARSARVGDGHTDSVPDDVVAKGKTAAEKFLLRWRGEADPRHVKAIDTYWVCTAEHGLNASTFTARIVASTGADCGAALSAAVGALSGPLHGGAPAYVKPMLDEVAASGDPERWVEEALASGKRIMGFGHRIYRAEDPRSRILKRTARELGSPQVDVAEALEQVALTALQKRSPDRVLATNVEYYSAVVLDVAEIPPPLAPAMFACSRVAGWSAHILEQKQTGRLFRPSARYTGPLEREL